ncbi:MAG: PAS domain-containing sensor histidine kinase [Oligoflexia bacterium]|nr:PAS domain-containing sensor histidine kinase [Oligoflexia bacterium]
MEQENNPSPEFRRMSKDELSQRLNALQSCSGDNESYKEREEEFQKVLHELEVYQIELEMQNRELRDSREALEESHDRYVNLYDFAPTGYITFNDQGIMKELNLTTAGMLGVERRWLVERSIAPWIVSQDLPSFRQHIKKCQATEDRVIATLQLTRKDKEIIVVELLSVCSTHRETGEKVIRTAVIDITKKKELEDELQRSLNTLKEERKLREIFVSTLTHDLRTPLSAAKIGAELIIRNSGPEDKNRTLASRILGSTNRMDIMIQDLLDANRISAGQKLPLKIQDYDFVELVKQTIEVLVNIHGDRFQLKSPKSCPSSMDPSGMRRVIENICNNAVKYGYPKTPITLTIQPTSDIILFSVHNEGPAIPRKDQAMLFNQFQRSQSAQTSEKKGWGVGLTLIRGIVESHGGNVHLESDSDKGTTFIIELPSLKRSKESLN